MLDTKEFLKQIRNVGKKLKKNKRKLNRILVDLILFIAGCTMFGWYTSIFLERLLS